MTLRTLLTAIVVPSLALMSAVAPRPAVSDREVALTASCSYPAQAISLTNWKLTLPTGDPARPTVALSVSQPTLAKYRNPPYFVVNTNCVGVGFQAPVNGVTTSGSKYPRSELREMTNNGQDEADWSSTVGTHKISSTMKFDKLPSTKPHVVGLQIHDALDDVATFRLEGTKLWVTNGDNSNFFLVTGSYKLGTVITIGFEVGGGQVKAIYNNKTVVTFPATFTGGYFKAGTYTQANCTNSTPCDGGNYGRTYIYALGVSHKVTAAQRMAGAVRSLLGMS